MSTLRSGSSLRSGSVILRTVKTGSVKKSIPRTVKVVSATKSVSVKMISKKQLNMWKQLWDIFISDEAFRQYYTNHRSYDLVVGDNTPIRNTKGTLYIPPEYGEQEGHFTAYKFNGNEIQIFDPSAYAYQQFNSTPGLAESVAARSKKIVKRLASHPQDHCEGDTFCQTWSLAWLDDNLKNLTNVNSKTTSINSMHNIVRAVANNPKFSKYMLNTVNRVNFNLLIKQSQRDFGIPDSTCTIVNVNDFVQFSKQISKDDIKRIMMNKT